MLEGGNKCVSECRHLLAFQWFSARALSGCSLLSLPHTASSKALAKYGLFLSLLIVTSPSGRTRGRFPVESGMEEHGFYWNRGIRAGVGGRADTPVAEG